jgi:hypothetical protein
LAIFSGPRLDHQDRVARSGHPQIEFRTPDLLIGRVEDPFPFDPPDAHRADRAAPGNVGDRQRRRGADDRRDVERVLRVGRPRVHDDLDIVAQVLGEERPQRPVRQAGGEDRRFRRPALAPEERAGDGAAGVHPLFIIHREREEIDPLARILAHGGGGEEQRIADPHCHGSAGMRRQSAGGDLEGLSFHHRVKHLTVQHISSMGGNPGSGTDDHEGHEEGPEAHEDKNSLWELPIFLRVFRGSQPLCRQK